MRTLGMLLCCAIMVGCQGHLRTDDVAAELRAMHEASLRAHIEGDWEYFQDLADEQVFSLRDGEISSATPGETGDRFRNYLSRASFTRYEDLDDPIVHVSDDGTLGWVIAHVRVEGEMDAGLETEESFGTTWSWVALFRKVEGRWRLAGNASTRSPD